MWHYNDPNTLMHYGIKGMKWGVRRYQNYDGTYTKKGLARYKQSEAKYDEAARKYRETKATGDKAATKAARSEMRIARRNVKRDYKQLRNDYDADKGRELYSKGITIGENNRRQYAIEAASIGASYVATGLVNQFDKPVAGYLANVASGYVFYGAEYTRRLRNKRLRAYYSHSRGVAPV